MVFDERIAREIAQKLLQIKAIQLNSQSPFLWASGWHSPIYCDNRKTLSYPNIRNLIKETFTNLLTKEFSEADAIAGVATAGIPHGALLADNLQLPFGYVRTGSKGHGLQNKIEGKFKKGRKVVVVEDLISTGKSSLAAVDALKAAGVDVVGLMAIFSYDFNLSRERFEQAGCSYYTLSNYHYLIEEAVKGQYIDNQEVKSLREWRKNPTEWNG